MVTALKSQKNFDPLKVPTQKIPFDRKVGAIHLKGDIEVKEMTITGLSHVRRIGDAAIENNNGSFTAKLHLGDSNVKFHANLTINVGNLIHPHVSVDADIGDIAVQFAVAIGADGKPALKQFDIDEFRHVALHVHGLGALDPLVDLVGDAFILFGNTQARHLITTIVRPIIESELKNFKLG